MLSLMLRDYLLAIFKKRSVIKSVTTSLVSYIVLTSFWLLPLPDDIRAVSFFHPTWWVWVGSFLIALAYVQFLAFQDVWDKFSELKKQKDKPDLVLTCLRTDDGSMMLLDGVRTVMPFSFNVQNTTDYTALNVILSPIKITTVPPKTDMSFDENTLSFEIIPGQPEQLTIEFGELQSVFKSSSATLPCMLLGVGTMQRFDLIRVLMRDRNFIMQQLNVYPVILGYSDLKGMRYEIEYALEFNALGPTLFCRRKGASKEVSSGMMPV